MAEKKEEEGTTGAACSARASDRGDSSLDPVQRQRVDRAFERLFGFAWREDGGDATTGTTTAEVLSDLLGSRRAAVRLLRSHRHLAKWRVAVRRRNSTKSRDDAAISLPPPPPPARSRTASRLASSSSAKTSQDQPRSESGNDNDNKRPAATDVPATAKNKSGGVDNLLQQLSGPDKVSTVAKTHTDWDQFKQRTGLGETLEEQADSKTAFLKKQDFLHRVDHRTFEKERAERDRERAKRGK